MKKVEKGIYQRGLYSFQVKMMIAGHKLDKTFDTLSEARVFRDGHRMSQALDVHESAIIESRIKNQEAVDQGRDRRRCARQILA